jgi:general secretion pathway protein F
MQFLVKALDARQRVVALTLEASTGAIAADAACKLGLKVLSVRTRGIALVFPRRHAAGFPVTLFSIELASLLEAGLNLVEALQTLADKEASGERQVVLGGILEAIYRGEAFSRAVARFPQHFSPLYVATLKASERTGDVSEALSRYIAYQEEIERVRKKVVSAMIYPSVLMLVGTLVIAFLMFYVVPRFAHVYEDVSGNLPFFSAMLLAAGRGLQRNGWPIGLALAAVAVLGAYGLSLPRFRAWINERLWRIPAVGERMKIYQLARAYRTVGMLLRAGIPAVRSLDMVRGLLSAQLRPQLARAKQLVEQGQPMSSAMSAVGLATPVASRMMLVGERSGEMGEMMERIARFHDDQIARYVEWFTRAFEPLLMAALGVAVGLVVVLMYMPIFELAGSIR